MWEAARGKESRWAFYLGLLILFIVDRGMLIAQIACQTPLTRLCFGQAASRIEGHRHRE